MVAHLAWWGRLWRASSPRASLYLPSSTSPACAAARRFAICGFKLCAHTIKPRRMVWTRHSSVSRENCMLYLHRNATRDYLQWAPSLKPGDDSNLRHLLNVPALLAVATCVITDSYHLKRALLAYTAAQRRRKAVRTPQHLQLFDASGKRVTPFSSNHSSFNDVLFAARCANNCFTPNALAVTWLCLVLWFTQHASAFYTLVWRTFFILQPIQRHKRSS